MVTGETALVRTTVEWAFADVGTTLERRGEGGDEQGFDKASGKCVVAVDPHYFCRTEIDLLFSDPTKVRTVLD